MLSLIPLAENVVKLNAVCMNCFKDAAFTMRLGSETKVHNNPQLVSYFLKNITVVWVNCSVRVKVRVPCLGSFSFSVIR